jgi:hypothetical protein
LDGGNRVWALAYAVFGVVVFGALYPRLAGRRASHQAAAPVSA